MLEYALARCLTNQDYCTVDEIVGQLEENDDTPLSNLYMCMLEAFGNPLERFADSTGKLVRVLALDTPH